MVDYIHPLKGQMRGKLPRVLFVHNCRTTFVQIDLDALKEKFVVTELMIHSRKVNPFHLWKQVAEHDVVFGWFASWHTFLPMLFSRLLGKPSVLVIGGYDVAKMSKIKYGHQRGGIKKMVSRWTMQLSFRLIAFSYYSQLEAHQNAGVSKDKISVVYQGVPDRFRGVPSLSRGKVVLTVGNVDRVNLWRKGHEPFVRAAAYLPEVRFVLVGAWRDSAIKRLRAIAPPNVTFTGWVKRSRLLDYYRQASVYVQPSLHEGFGMSVAEAMLAGCVPVVTRRGALPEVVGDCGIYVDEPDPQQLAQAIRQALEAPESLRRRARERILTQFPMEKRARALHQIISEVLEQKE